MVCCFTGHRVIEESHIYRLPELLSHTLERLISRGVTTFRAGGALGFDTIAALKVLEKKKSNPDVRLELMLPCRNQAEGWTERERFVYSYILERADKVTYAEERYVSGCMYKRNRMLVDGADYCVAFLSKNEGGTAYTARYALSKDVELINLYYEMEES
jgi:uncharacterized phage-like protein YoqJ